MKNHPGSKYFSFISGVIDTCDQPLFSNISANFHKNFNALMVWFYQGPRGRKKPEAENRV
jgi:hypothetical protein